MRKLAFAFVLIGLACGCATNYHSRSEGGYQPFYAMVVLFAKEGASADSALHRFILEAKWDEVNAPLGYRVTYTQCDRGEINSDYIECLFMTSRHEIYFKIKQIRENPNTPLKQESNTVVGTYMCGKVIVGVSENELRLNGNGAHDPEYLFNLHSHYKDSTCQFQITTRALVNAKVMKANK